LPNGEAAPAAAGGAIVPGDGTLREKMRERWRERRQQRLQEQQQTPAAP
jgi:hypothetical protein